MYKISVLIVKSIFKGIGKGIALQLAKCGAQVIALDMFKDQLGKLFKFLQFDRLHLYLYKFQKN